MFHRGCGLAFLQQQRPHVILSSENLELLFLSESRRQKLESSSPHMNEEQRNPCVLAPRHILEENFL